MPRSLPVTRWRALALASGVVLATWSTGCLPAARCSADEDCTGGRVCVDGLCDDNPGNTSSGGSSGVVGTSSGATGVSSSARSGSSGATGGNTSRPNSSSSSGAPVSSSNGSSTVVTSVMGSSSSGGGSSTGVVVTSSSAAPSSSLMCNPGTCATPEGCVPDGTISAANPCAVCDVARSTTAFSPVLDGRVCDDQDPCTPTSSCNATGQCTGVGARDMDGDTYIDVACNGGTDCDDNNNAIHPGVPDPVDGVTADLSTVDPGGVRGSWVDAVGDANGHVHAVFANTTRNHLEYLTNSAGYWAVATVDNTGVGGTHARIALGPNNSVHLAHWEDGGNDLVYVSNASGAWVRELVTTDTTADSGQYVSLLVDADGTVHAVYFDNTTDDLVWRQRSTTTGWGAAVPLDTVGTAGNGTVLFVDGTGQKRVAYHSSNGDCLRQGVLTTPFLTEIVDNPSPDVGYSPRFFLDPSGAEHIFHTGAGVLRHSWRANNTAAWTNVDASSASVPTDLRMGAARLTDGRLWTCVADGDPINGMALLLIRSGNTGWANQENQDVTVLAAGFTAAPPCAVAALPNGHAAVMYSINGTQVDALVTRDGVPQPQTVDGAGDRGRNPAMVVDAMGTLHVAAYDASATSLRYSRKPLGGVWQSEEVDNVASVGSHASIALDSTGVLHFAYYDASANALRYTSGVPGAWAPSVIVDNTSNSGLYTSIMLDGSNNPYIAYVANSVGQARLAQFQSGSWVHETVASGVTAYLSAARDATGRFHLAWQAGSVLTYTRGVSGSWEAPRSADAVAGGQYVRLVLDSQGNPHLFHYAPAPDDLRHAFSPTQGDVGTFTADIAAATGVSGQYAAAAVDPAGNAGAIFLENGVGMVLVQQAAGAWTRTPLNASNYQGGALVLGANGTFEAVFYDDSLNSLRHVSSSIPGLGPLTTIAPASDPGTWSALDVDNLGRPHTAWRDNRTNTLRYATLSQGLWFHTTLDTAADTGRFVSVKTSADGAVHLAYHHESAGDLIYGRLFNGAYARELVDNSAGDVGEYASLGLTANGTPHIAYHDVSNRDLKHAFKNGSNWIVATRESTNDQGRYASLAVDRQGFIHIAWRDETTNDLKYMSNVGGTWNVSVVAEGLASTNDYGSYTSIAVDDDGVVSIAHRDASAADLRVVTNRSGAFVGQPVDANGNVGTHNSMCVDGPGNQVVAYRSETATDLKLAVGDVTGLWQTFNVEVSGNAVGTYASMARSPDGTFYVSYFDDSANRLRVARVTVNNAVDDNCDGF